MNRKRFILVVIAVAVAAVAAAVVAGAVHGAVQSPPAADEAAMRRVVVAYDLEQNPVVPAKFYGRQLTIGPCITLLKTHAQRLEKVATSTGIYPTDIGWLYLAGIKRQIYELHGALPVSWDGKLVFLGGDRRRRRPLRGTCRRADDAPLGDLERGQEAARPAGQHDLRSDDQRVHARAR